MYSISIKNKLINFLQKTYFLKFIFIIFLILPTKGFANIFDSSIAFESGIKGSQISHRSIGKQTLSDFATNFPNSLAYDDINSCLSDISLHFMRGVTEGQAGISARGIGPVRGNPGYLSYYTNSKDSYFKKRIIRIGEIRGVIDIQNKIISILLKRKKLLTQKKWTVSHEDIGGSMSEIKIKLGGYEHDEINQLKEKLDEIESILLIRVELQKRRIRDLERDE